MDNVKEQYECIILQARGQPSWYLLSLVSFCCHLKSRLPFLQAILSLALSWVSVQRYLLFSDMVLRARGGLQFQWRSANIKITASFKKGKHIPAVPWAQTEKLRLEKHKTNKAIHRLVTEQKKHQWTTTHNEMGGAERAAERVAGVSRSLEMTQCSLRESCKMNALMRISWAISWRGLAVRSADLAATVSWNWLRLPVWTRKTLNQWLRRMIYKYISQLWLSQREGAEWECEREKYNFWEKHGAGPTDRRERVWRIINSENRMKSSGFNGSGNYPMPTLGVLHMRQCDKIA